MKKSICICLCTLVIANVFASTVIAQIQKIDNISEKTTKTRIHDENNIHNIYMSMINNPPIMVYIDGPTTIHALQLGKWSFKAYDNDSLLIKFHVDWGDGYAQFLIWRNCVGGAVDSATHIYQKEGNYIITVYAQDYSNERSEDMTFDVKVLPPRNKAINTPFLQFQLNFLQNHPNLFPVIQKIIQRLEL